MKPDIQFREPTPPRLEELASNMRELDLIELTRVGFSGPLECLRTNVANSVYAECAVVDGKVLAAWGLVMHDVLGGDGYPWLFTAEGIEKHRFAFIASAQAVVSELLSYSSRLYVAVDAEYKGACRLMMWLGFWCANELWLNGHRFLEFRHEEV